MPDLVSKASVAFDKYDIGVAQLQSKFHERHAATAADLSVNIDFHRPVRQRSAVPVCGNQYVAAIASSFLACFGRRNGECVYCRLELHLGVWEIVQHE